MDYSEYIELGFKRIEMNDNVELNQTGYSGFFLEKKINENSDVTVWFGELDKPKMQITQQDNATVHTVILSCEMVKSLFYNTNCRKA